MCFHFLEQELGILFAEFNNSKLHIMMAVVSLDNFNWEAIGVARGPGMVAMLDRLSEVCGNPIYVRYCAKVLGDN